MTSLVSNLKMKQVNKRNKTETESDTDRCVQRGLGMGVEVSSWIRRYGLPAANKGVLGMKLTVWGMQE